MVQHRLEKHLALWIVSGTREEGEEGYGINRRKLWLDFEINHWKFEWIERIHVVCVQHYKFNKNLRL